MLREEDELSGTWESEGEDEDAGPDPHGMESDINLTEVDMSDMDMNKVEPDRVVGIFTKHNSNCMEKVSLKYKCALAYPLTFQPRPQGLCSSFPAPE